jgi:hypothetical protein
MTLICLDTHKNLPALPWEGAGSREVSLAALGKKWRTLNQGTQNTQGGGKMVSKGTEQLTPLKVIGPVQKEFKVLGCP